MSRAYAGLLMAVLTLGACADKTEEPAVETPAIDTAAEEQAVRAVSARWLELERAKDAAGIAALFASDGAAYREDRAPIEGAAAVQAHMEQNFKENPSEVVDWSTDQVDMAASGDLATERGTWSVRNSGPDGKGEDNGKYVTIYRKINGEWKVVADMSVSTKAPPTS